MTNDSREKKDKRIAVLIDADNVSDKYIKAIIDEVANHGTPTYKRIYGDWTKPQLASWKTVLLNYSISPIQQYSYTSGKNATDAALIIDAMDILYSDKVDGFCIVSSDSDFTRLAIRLREAGMKVIGIGQKKTPLPFITACDKFVYIEILKNEQPSVSETTSQIKGKTKVQPKALNRIDQHLIKLLTESVADLADESGWTFLGELGNFILKNKADFDPRNYGFPKLLPLIKSTKKFVIDERTTGTNNIRHIYLKVK